MLIPAGTLEAVGDWDERFFLYSEETDFCRRVRDSGGSIWYEPEAVMTHSQGGSGSSAELTALLAVNKVRYAQKHSPAWAAALFRSISLLGAVSRFWEPGHRLAARCLADSGSWDRLPGPAEVGEANIDLTGCTGGTVIIPAHNEEASIGRLLDGIRPLIAAGTMEFIVACNGCSDRTADIARSYSGVKVLELSKPSKVAALNAADDVATKWPRLYLDADVEIGPAAINKVFEALEDGTILAARPASRYDDDGAAWIVKSFYRARRRVFTRPSALWGAGAYALSQEGHDRFGRFPDLTADDLFVDRQFAVTEKAVLDTPPTNVRTPRDLAGLMAVLKRNYRGKNEVLFSELVGPPDSLASRPGGARATLTNLVTSATGPASAVDALVYATLVAGARIFSRAHSGAPGRVWERDESSRTV